jgi:predicted nucleic acid-binding protein
MEEIRLLLRDYSTWEIVMNTAASILGALDIESRYETSFWDALILHAAEASGATILYSENLAKGQRYGAIRVVNPLVDS